ncbi:MAG: DinB family protein [Gemmatimonadales bacterium]
MYRLRQQPWLLALALLIPVCNASAQRPTGMATLDSSTLMDRRALEVFRGIVASDIVSAAEAMPADKYGFAPTEGEFSGVRTFGRQVKHLAATNYTLAAAALGQDPPTDAGDEAGPDTVRTKDEVLRYLRGSFTALENAITAIGDRTVTVRSSPISPLQGGSATRLALVVEALIHAFDHYGQMVVYLRMNGVVPPASRR